MTTHPAADEHLAAAPADARAALEKLRKTIKAAVPNATEVISYQLPTISYKGHPLVSFGARKNHCAFYVRSRAVMRAHAAQLKGYDVSTGAIRFPAGKPLPAALVKKLVKARIAENEAQAKRKSDSKAANNTEKVNEFMRKLKHPFKAEVQSDCSSISAPSRLNWKAPEW